MAANIQQQGQVPRPTGISEWNKRRGEQQKQAEKRFRKRRHDLPQRPLRKTPLSDIEISEALEDTVEDESELDMKGAVRGHGDEDDPSADTSASGYADDDRAPEWEGLFWENDDDSGLFLEADTVNRNTEHDTPPSDSDQILSAGSARPQQDDDLSTSHDVHSMETPISDAAKIQQEDRPDSGQLGGSTDTHPLPPSNQSDATQPPEESPKETLLTQQDPSSQGMQVGESSHSELSMTRGGTFDLDPGSFDWEDDANEAEEGRLERQARANERALDLLEGAVRRIGALTARSSIQQYDALNGIFNEGWRLIRDEVLPVNDNMTSVEALPRVISSLLRFADRILEDVELSESMYGEARELFQRELARAGGLSDQVKQREREHKENDRRMKEMECRIMNLESTNRDILEENGRLQENVKERRLEEGERRAAELHATNHDLSMEIDRLRNDVAEKDSLLSEQQRELQTLEEDDSATLAENFAVEWDRDELKRQLNDKDELIAELKEVGDESSRQLKSFMQDSETRIEGMKNNHRAQDERCKAMQEENRVLRIDMGRWQRQRGSTDERTAPDWKPRRKTPLAAPRKILPASSRADLLADREIILAQREEMQTEMKARLATLEGENKLLRRDAECSRRTLRLGKESLGVDATEVSASKSKGRGTKRDIQAILEKIDVIQGLVNNPPLKGWEDQGMHQVSVY